MREKAIIYRISLFEIKDIRELFPRSTSVPANEASHTHPIKSAIWQDTSSEVVSASRMAYLNRCLSYRSPTDGI